MTCQHEHIQTWRFDDVSVAMWGCAACGRRFIPQTNPRGLTTAERKVLWNQTKKPSAFAEAIEAKLFERINHDA